MDKSNNKDPENQPKSFQSKSLLIWLAVIAGVIAILIGQSGEIQQNPTLSSVDELISAARDDLIREARIQSDPKGGEEWYVIRGDVRNPDYEYDETLYPSLPFVVKGESAGVRSVLVRLFDKNENVIGEKEVSIQFLNINKS